MLIKLEGSPSKIREYNRFVAEFNMQNHKDENGEHMTIDKVNDIDDVFIPYESWIDELRKENIRLINDIATDFTGVYISHDPNTHLQLPCFTDYVVDNNYDDIITPFLGYDYGVCDNASQVLSLLNYIKEQSVDGIAKKQMDGDFIIRLMPVFRDDDSCWRWHKWGAYIGVQKHEYEYIRDEENIDLVYAFRIYRVKKEQKEC